MNRVLSYSVVLFCCIANVASVFAVNCANWESCFTGDVRFANWVGDWATTVEPGDWVADYVPVDPNPTPIAGYPGRSYSITVFHWGRNREEEREGKVQVQLKDCVRNEYENFWAHVVSANYWRTVRETWTKSIKAVTDASDPNNIIYFDPEVIIDAKLDIPGVKLLLDYDPVAQSECSE